MVIIMILNRKKLLKVSISLDENLCDIRLKCIWLMMNFLKFFYYLCKIILRIKKWIKYIFIYFMEMIEGL